MVTTDPLALPTLEAKNDGNNNKSMSTKHTEESTLALNLSLSDEFETASAQQEQEQEDIDMTISISVDEETPQVEAQLPGEEEKLNEHEAQTKFNDNTNRKTTHPYECIGLNIIGPTSLMELATCYGDSCFRQDNDDSSNNRPYFHSTRRLSYSKDSLLSEDSDGEDEGCSGEEEPEDVLPGGLAAGVQYHPKRILVEGWLHKKGTGMDWMGNRSWKARWGRLALASVDGYDIDLPLLLIYWYPSSEVASTAIVLDSAVVLGVDMEDKEWNAYRFEIRNAATKENASIPVTRTFCCPQKARDSWVYAISEALLEYEKEKAAFRKVSNAASFESSPGKSQRLNSYRLRANAAAHHADVCPKSPGVDEVWTGDRFPTTDENQRPPSPTCSPESLIYNSNNLRKFSSPPCSPTPQLYPKAYTPPTSPVRGGPGSPSPSSSPRPKNRIPIPRAARPNKEFLAGESLA